MRSLESRVRANLKCHFGGLAMAIPELETATEGGPASKMNPNGRVYDVEAARTASYRATSELAYDRYGTRTANQPGTQQPNSPGEASDALSKARQKVFETLRASAEIAEVSDLYPDSRFKGSATYGAFAPIFFVYRIPDKVPTNQEDGKAPVKRFYFVYNGRFMIVAAFCEPDEEVPALSETVSEVCLLMSKTGYEFRWLSPIPTVQSLDQGGASAISSPMAGILNDSVGRAGTTTILFTNKPKSIQDSLRSLYATSFQFLVSFYSLKEESDSQKALFKTIEAHRETVLDLMHEFNQTKGRQFLRRRKLRKLIKGHCFNLTEKIGRVDAISDSLDQGIISLDSNLQQDRALGTVFGSEPDWKGYLRHEFDTRPVMEMVTRTSEEISRPDVGLMVFLVALLAAAAGAIVGSFLGRIL